MRNYINPDVVLKLNHGPCRWIAVRYDGSRTECGKLSVPGSPYCEEHMAMRVTLNNQPLVKASSEPATAGDLEPGIAVKILPEEVKVPARRRLTSKPTRQDLS